MDRVILHSDLNGFYAGVECFRNPGIRTKPVAVCGDAELRHGIVLAKNEPAKKFGIKTGDVIWEAKQKCPDLVTVPADFKCYERYSKIVKHIYKDYTDRVESFGIDEAWLDVTGLDGYKTAQEIRKRVTYETGLTVSIGVSWNKIFAKLGSDMKKPDAVTVIDRQNYKHSVWTLPAEDLLLVGRATKQKLNKLNIKTIGDIATADVSFLKQKLNKWGEYIHYFANGGDLSPVSPDGDLSPVKSVGNSTTTIRDLKTTADVYMIVTVLAESVAARLREQWLKGRTVTLYVRDELLMSWAKQVTLESPTFISGEIINAAMYLFGYHDFRFPIRSVGVKVSSLRPADTPTQTSVFASEAQREKQERLEFAIDGIRSYYGHFSLNRATEWFDRELTCFNPKDENTIHPYSYFK